MVSNSVGKASLIIINVMNKGYWYVFTKKRVPSIARTMHYTNDHLTSYINCYTICRTLLYMFIKSLSICT